MPFTVPRIALVASLALASAACDDPADAEPAPDAVTWHAHVAPIVAVHCASCHTEGGVAPFVFDSFESAAPMAEVGLASIEAGRMPPWSADPDCRTLDGARIMPPADVDILRAWIAAGKPEGDPSTAAALPTPEIPMFEPTHVAAPATPYVPDDSVTDDYRCQLLDVEFAETMFLTGALVEPDAGALVHHVLVYAVAPDEVDAVLAAEAEHDGAGYPCFGGPLPTAGGGMGGGALPTQIGGWVPGAAPRLYPEGTGVPIEAGSRIVMQVHYNLIAAPAEPDATALAMRLTDVPVELEVVTRPLAIRSLDIPAGEAEAVNARVFRNYTDQAITLNGMTAHMHLLGRRFRSHIERADGTESCLLDIPEWDFDWQQGYALPRDGWVDVEPGEAIMVECVYDNSPANQPIVDGEPIEPRDVGWGDGTFDEMCLLYMSIVRPYAPTPPPEEACQLDAGCLDACAAEERSSADCLIACAPHADCATCAVQQGMMCGGATCIAPFNALRADGCLEHCFVTTLMIGGDTTACFADECPDVYGAFATCLGGVLDEGMCDESLAAACGIDRSGR